MKPQVPPYVWLGKKGEHRTAMRLRKEVGTERWQYYRDAGHWSCAFEFRGDQLVVKGAHQTSHLDGMPLTMCSKAEWENDNRGYV